MTLNGVMALFCIISANSGSFRGALRKNSRSLSHLVMSSCETIAVGPQYLALITGSQCPAPGQRVRATKDRKKEETKKKRQRPKILQ